MWDGTLALMTRALRTEARLVRTHLFRLLFAGLLCAGLMAAHLTSGWYGAPGRMFFSQIVYLNLVLITLAGISFFSTAVTEEKDEGTLGLLLMAGMSPLSILLGKSTTRLMSASLLLAVQFPFVLLAITLGGVTLRQVVAAFLTLLAYMVLLANLGLVSSVVARRSGSASAATAALLAAWFLLAPLVRSANVAPYLKSSGWPGVATSLERGLDLLAQSTPDERVSEIMTTGFAGAILGPQLFAMLIAALLLFLLAWGGFHRFTGPDEPRRRGRRTPSRAARWLRPERAWANALLWKDYHFVTGGKTLMAVKLLIYGAVASAAAVYVARFHQGRITEFGDLLMAAMLVVATLEACLYAARFFQDEVRGQTLSLLLLLPRSTAEIAFSKAAGCGLALLPAAGFFLVGGLCSFEQFWEGLLSPAVWIVLVVLATLLHLTAYFSLVVRWGALPLAIAVVFLLHQCCPVLSILIAVGSIVSHQEPMMILPIAAYGAGVLLPLDLMILHRLREVGSR